MGTMGVEVVCGGRDRGAWRTFFVDRVLELDLFTTSIYDRLIALLAATPLRIRYFSIQF